MVAWWHGGMWHSGMVAALGCDTWRTRVHESSETLRRPARHPVKQRGKARVRYVLALTQVVPEDPWLKRDWSAEAENHSLSRLPFVELPAALSVHPLLCSLLLQYNPVLKVLRLRWPLCPLLLDQPSGSTTLSQVHSCLPDLPSSSHTPFLLPVPRLQVNRVCHFPLSLCQRPSYTAAQLFAFAPTFFTPHHIPYP